MSVSENMNLKKIFVLSREDEKGRGGKLYKKDLQVLFLIKCYSGNQIKENATGEYMALIGGKKEMHTQFLWGSLKEREHIKELGVDDA